MIGPNDPIVLPEFSEEVSFEAELCVVIGRICKDVPEDRVDDVIFGYTCGNDLTARDVQKTDLQWARAKGFDTSAPLGPWIETELDTEDLQIQGRLNGELRQDGSTSQMIRGVRELVSIVSQAFTLLPGDVIMTGTPAGVGARPGRRPLRGRDRGHRPPLQPGGPPLDRVGADFGQPPRGSTGRLSVSAAESGHGVIEIGNVGTTMTTASAPDAVSSSASRPVKSPPTPRSVSGSARRPRAPRTSA